MSPSSLTRSLLKGTALFGGTQLFTVLASVLRGKLTAVLIGTAGVGLVALYSSTLAPLQHFFSMGIPLAVVSAVAAIDASQAAGQAEVCRRVEASRRALLILALLGVATLVAGSALWSRLAFGDTSQTMAYVWLGAALLFMILEGGEMAILQSRRCMRQVALCSVVRALAGLAVAVPFYWLWGTRGIVPALIAGYAVMWGCARWLTWREGLGQRHLPWREAWSLSRGVMTLGFFLMLATLLGSLATLGINATIQHLGSTSDVGLYQAATSITGQYVGLVFAAMATDYYPRLSALTEKRGDMQILVGQEHRLVLLVTLPLVLALIVTAPLLIRVLLTAEFLPLTGVVRLMGLGILCRAACFPIDYVSMAYGRKRYFFWMEGVWCNAKTFALIVAGYALGGIEGIGWATLVSGLIDVAVTTVATSWVFGISTWRRQVTTFLPALAVGSVCVAATSHGAMWAAWLIALAGSVVSAWLIARSVSAGSWLARQAWWRSIRRRCHRQKRP